MILWLVILCIITWGALLAILKQYNRISRGEYIVLWGVVWLALSTFVLFLQSLLLWRFSFWWPCSLALILTTVALWKNRTIFFQASIKQWLRNLYRDYSTHRKSSRRWQKYAMSLMGIMVLVKVCMVFSLNLAIPTFDEDAVAWRDMKTKVFVENQSLVLDKNDPDFLWTDLSRFPFAGLIDTYFLLWQDSNSIIGETNIISPLIYLASVIILFSIFYRLTSLFYAVVSAYMYTSMPFLFIHWFGSYWNLFSGFILFVVVFYVIDQIILKKNTALIRALLPLGVLYWVVRNEGLALILIVTSVLIGIMFYHNKRKYIVWYIWLWLMGWVAYALRILITSMYPYHVSLNTGWATPGVWVVWSMIANITKPGVFSAPFTQALYHPDYNVFFTMFLLTLIWAGFSWKKVGSHKMIACFGIVSLLVLGIFMVTLYGNVEWLWLLTHFAFIRYPLGVIHILLFTTLYTVFTLLEEHHA